MPAQAKQKATVSPRRRSLLGKVHIAKKQLGLTDDEYRGILQAQFQVNSAKKLSDRRLTSLIEFFKAKGFQAKPKKPRPSKSSTPQPAKEKEQLILKMRALWISLFHLGVTYDRSDDGLTAFARRVSGGKNSGVQALHWLDQESAYKVIEAMKKMAERDADVDWSAYRVLHGAETVSVYKPRARVLESQWQIMFDLDLVEIKEPGALSSYARRICRHHQHCSHTQLSDEQLDQVIVTFGMQIRARLKALEFKTIKQWRERT